MFKVLFMGKHLLANGSGEKSEAPTGWFTPATSDAHPDSKAGKNRRQRGDRWELTVCGREQPGLRRSQFDPLRSAELERTGRSQVLYVPSVPRTLPVARLAAEAEDRMCADKWL